MNVYDFDKTICKDDTETDFFFYELRRHPINLFNIFKFINAYFKHKNGRISHEEYRKRTYSILKHIKDIDLEVKKFWDKRKNKILSWYLDVKKDDDVIISATPEFLLTYIFNEISIKNYICSQFDIKKGECIGKMCYGKEKLDRFKKKYNSASIDNFYTDSLTDLPLLEYANKGFLITKDYQIVEWKKDETNI